MLHTLNGALAPENTEIALQDFDMLSIGDEANTTAELADLDNALNMCHATVASLESIQSVMVATQEDGGMNAQAANMQAVAVNAAMTHFGQAAVTFDQESFSDAGGRATATAFGIEGIGEQIKKIWAAIKDFVMKYVKKVKEFFSKHLSSAGRLVKAAKSLGESAEKSKGTPKEKTLKYGASDFRAVSKDGKVDAVTDIKELTAALKASEKDEDSIKVIEAYIDGLEGFDSKATGTSEFYERFKNLLTAVPKSGTTDERYKNDADNGLFYTLGDVVIGSKRLLTTYKTQKTEDNRGYVESIKFAYVDSVAKPKSKDENKVDALNSSQIQVLCTQIATTAELVRKYDTKKYDKAVADLLKAADKASTELAGADKSDKTSESKFIEKIIRNVSTASTALLTGPVENVKCTFASAKVGYTYASRSYSNLKAAK